MAFVGSCVSVGRASWNIEMTTTTSAIDYKIEYEITDDIKPQWLNVIRRLQSACYGNQGLAVLSIRVLVDERGEPILWTEPSRIKLEPKATGLETLLDLTSEGGR
jgi:hypothetical protein